MTINADMIFAVKEQTDKHHISSNTGYSDQQIYYYLLKTKNYFLYRKYQQNNNRVSSQNEMKTPCLNLIEAKGCECVPPIGYEVSMTDVIIPNSITGIISVTNPDNSKEYVPTTSHLLKYRAKQRIKHFANETSYYEQNEGNGVRLYLFSKKPLKFVVATLIPEDPEDIYRMKDCKGNNSNVCVSTYDLEWKIDAELSKIIIDETIKIILGTKFTSTDVKNNAMDDNVANKAELK